MSRLVRVLVVDDSLTVRSIARALLSQDQDIFIVGEAGSGEEALAMIPDLRPDVLALDETLPGMDGLALIDAVRAARYDVKVVLISSSTWAGAPLCGTAVQHGAAACFDKSRMVADSDLLISLIKQTAAGVRSCQAPVSR